MRNSILYDTIFSYLNTLHGSNGARALNCFFFKKRKKYHRLPLFGGSFEIFEHFSCDTYIFNARLTFIVA